MKTWITIPTSSLDSVDFSQVSNTDSSSTPKNIAGDTALIKWSGDMPSSITAISGKGEALDYAGALALLETVGWKPDEENP
jgi:hypothetical protein